MLTILHLGTAECDRALEAALVDHLDPVTMAVPAEPRLLGALAAAPGIQADVHALAGLVADKAIDRAGRIVANNRQALGSVFDAEPDEPPGITRLVLDAPLEDTLAEGLAQAGTETAWASREALDILGMAGIDVSGLLAPTDIDLNVS